MGGDCKGLSYALALGQQNFVDDVDDTVISGNICLGDVGFVDRHFVSLHLNRDRFARHGWDIAGLNVA